MHLASQDYLGGTSEVEHIDIAIGDAPKDLGLMALMVLISFFFGLSIPKPAFTRQLATWGLIDRLLYQVRNHDDEGLDTPIQYGVLRNPNPTLGPLAPLARFPGPEQEALVHRLL